MAKNILEAIEREELGGAYGLNSPISYCCNHTQFYTQIIRKIGDSQNYEGLLGLDYKEFSMWQDQLVRGSYSHLKSYQGKVLCQGCNKNIESHRDAYVKGGQFYHRGDCSSDYYGNNKESTLDLYERLYQSRLATGVVSDIEFLEDDSLSYNSLHILFRGGATHIYTSEHDDFRIHVNGAAYIECKENDEIGIFFRCLRFLLENGMNISEIIGKLEKHFGRSFLGINDEPIKGHEIIIENIFTDNLYNEAPHSYRNDITNYDLCESINISLARMIGILRLSQGQRRASIIQGMNRIMNGEYLELLDI